MIREPKNIIIGLWKPLLLELELKEYFTSDYIDKFTDRILLYDLLKLLFETLTPREAETIYLYFWEEMTFKAIATRFRSSATRVSQIFYKGLARLRHPNRSKHLKEFKYLEE